jgi:hypothetical protein
MPRSERAGFRRSFEQGENLLMRIENPVRLGGLAAISAGVLLIISDLLRLYINNLAGPGILKSDFFTNG